MNRYILLLACILVYSCSHQNVFSIVDYDEAIAYKYNGEGDIEIISRDGKLAGRIEKQTPITKKQAIKITNELCDASSYGSDVAACFDPHLGIVLYKEKKPVAHISICLDCNFLSSSIPIPAAESGFSDKGRERIEQFMKEMGF